MQNLTAQLKVLIIKVINPWRMHRRVTVVIVCVCVCVCVCSGVSSMELRELEHPPQLRHNSRKLSSSLTTIVTDNR